MRIGGAALVGLAVMAAACGTNVHHATTQRGLTAQAGTPYRLYTHCGIKWASIDGRFWRAKHPLSDGSGNPPVGWGNPFQDGTVVLIGPTTARFDSPAGTVTFERTLRTRPPAICS